MTTNQLTLPDWLPGIRPAAGAPYKDLAAAYFAVFNQAGRLKGDMCPLNDDNIAWLDALLFAPGTLEHYAPSPPRIAFAIKHMLVDGDKGFVSQQSFAQFLQQADTMPRDVYGLWQRHDGALTIADFMGVYRAACAEYLLQAVHNLPDHVDKHSILEAMKARCYQDGFYCDEGEVYNKGRYTVAATSVPVEAVKEAAKFYDQAVADFADQCQGTSAEDLALFQQKLLSRIAAGNLNPATPEQIL